MRFLLAIGIWVGTTTVALVVAWKLRIGRVVYDFGNRHGIHEGDVLAFLVAWIWAAYLTAALYRRRR